MHRLTKQRLVPCHEIHNYTAKKVNSCGPFSTKPGNHLAQKNTAGNARKSMRHKQMMKIEEPISNIINKTNSHRTACRNVSRHPANTKIVQNRNERRQFSRWDEKTRRKKNRRIINNIQQSYAHIQKHTPKSQSYALALFEHMLHFLPARFDNWLFLF